MEWTKLQRVALMVSVWAGIFAILTAVRYVIANGLGMLEPSELLTGTDALIAAAPIVLWILVAEDWEKFSFGPLTFQLRARQRISDRLGSDDFKRMPIADLYIHNKEQISATEAVKVVVGLENEAERYENLLAFVGRDGKEKIDWRHVQYLFFTDANGQLVGSMGPRRFRWRLENEGRAFRRALQMNDQDNYLEHGDEIQIRTTDSKTKILETFSENQLDWFPVIDEQGRPIGVVEPGGIAVRVLRDLARALGGH